MITSLTMRMTMLNMWAPFVDLPCPRDVCLIPLSAHGTNPASAQMAGMKVRPTLNSTL